MVTQNEFDPLPHNTTLVAHPILSQVALPYAIFFTATSLDWSLVAMVSLLPSLLEFDGPGTGMKFIPMWSTRFKHAI